MSSSEIGVAYSLYELGEEIPSLNTSNGVLYQLLSTKIEWDLKTSRWAVLAEFSTRPEKVSGDV